MVLPSLSVLLAVGYLVICVGGVVAYFRFSVGQDRPGTAVVVFLAIAIIFTGGTVAGHTSLDAQQIDYTVQQCHSAPNGTEVTSFDDLSPEGQEVFRSTLQAVNTTEIDRVNQRVHRVTETDNTDRETYVQPDKLSEDQRYTTKTNPDEFDLSKANYVTYESTCYALTADSRGSIGHGLMILLSLGFAGVGIVLILILLVIHLVSALYEQRSPETE